MIGSYLDKDAVVIVDNVRDVHQEISSTVLTSVDAFITRKTRMVRNQNGETVVSSSQVLMRDRTLPYTNFLRFDDKDHTIIAINEMRDFGVQAIEVFLQ